MPNKRTHKEPHRAAVKLFAAFILSIIVTAVIAHFWLIPAKVSREIKRALQKFWDGQVDIEDIDINYFAPIYLTRVSFSDKTGREYIYAEKVNMLFDKWPGLHPVVTEIQIEKLCLHFSAADGKFRLPVTNPYNQQRSGKKRMDIRKLSVNDIEMIFIDAQETKYLYDNLQLLANKNGNSYNFSLRCDNTEPPERLSVKGEIDLKTLETNLSLQVKHTVQEPEITLVFTALNIPNLSAKGVLEAELIINGRLKQLTELKPQGFISLEDWTVSVNDKIVTNNLTTKADVKDRHFNFENIEATVCGGDAVGSFYAEIKQNNTAEFSGQVFAENISFAELTFILGESGRKATKGALTFDYAFSGKGTDLQNLTGKGQIFLDNADISVVPILPHILNAIGLSQLDPLEMSDAECTFTTTGPIVNVETAHMANRLAAVNAEPGGTIDLQTKQINMHVVTIPIKQIDAIIRKIPIVNIFVNFKDKLTRLHIMGNWSDLPSKLIKKEPITDIKEATVGFFQDIIDSGGQITKKIHKKTNNPFKSKQQQNTN